MMNIIRADFYRISKSWVTYAPFAALALFHVAMMVYGSISVTGEYTSGTMYVGQLLDLAHFLFALPLIPFVFCVSVPSFSDGTMKNDISWGMSRTKLYVSKLLIMVILSILLYVFYIGAGMGVATIVFGFGDAVPGYWMNLLQAMGAQMVGVLALCSVMIFLSFLLKKPYVLTEALAGILMIPTLINWISSLFNVDASRVLYFDLLSNIQGFASFHLLDSRTILIGFGVIAVWLLATSIAGITLLRKAEVK
ncbi:MAG: ABC transporter permease [Oscillospiraceae bacterium]|nr:ABC transporter permease [Oscillospiraceae bacterium]